MFDQNESGQLGMRGFSTVGVQMGPLNFGSQFSAQAKPWEPSQ